MAKIHERTHAVQRAEMELAAYLVELTGKHNLSFAELVKITTSILATYSKYEIRDERHGNSEISGDLERGDVLSTESVEI